MICNICGKEMKLVPAGVSKKTGKPYNSFYSCWTCKKTAPDTFSTTGRQKVEVGRKISLEQFEQDLAKINRNIQSIVNKIIDLEKKVNGLETLIDDMGEKPARELHQATEDCPAIKNLREVIPIVSEEIETENLF